MQELPALTGKQLLKMLLADGWEIKRRVPHGVFLKKRFSNTTRLTTVKDTRSYIPNGTLGAILGPQQTGIGKPGLRALIAKYGRP
ncbi:MAG: hypothetical protein O2783_00695 [Chloroflexi bacterium]|nr:hypothetical protein [Chloroflexota bacterium]